jgi:hypothetical protein
MSPLFGLQPTVHNSAVGELGQASSIAETASDLEALSLAWLAG